MIHIPILRAGCPYRSLNIHRVRHVQTGEPIAEVSQSNRGLIAKDLTTAAHHKRALESLSVSELVAICKKAAHCFTDSVLPLGAESQSPGDYIRQLSATTGMPESLCRNNMNKIRTVLDEMEAVLGGLTRGLNLSILDDGWGVQDKRPLSYVRQTNVLGAVLPSNSPGVHSLWLPAIPMKTPLILKPGGEEPWTPYRIAQALIASDCPPAAFGFYPTDYTGAAEILLRSGRSMLFGGESTVTPWKTDPRVQIHGPGRSKIVIANDEISDWEIYLDVMIASIVDNGGRSCINASGIWAPAHSREIAGALAKRLAQIDALPLDDPQAQIAAFSNPKFARQLSSLIDDQLKTPGASDVTAEVRGGGRLVEKAGCTYLLPTVIWCESPEHPLANTEYLFPFVSVVEVPQPEILERIGSTLVVSAFTEDEAFINELLGSPDVERLNLGAISTNQIAWDQPHEGNLFEHLYRQRAFQMTSTRRKN